MFGRIDATDAQYWTHGGEFGDFRHAAGSQPSAISGDALQLTVNLLSSWCLRLLLRC